LLYKLRQSISDRRELQSNLKGFVTLSKYLLRGSRHKKTDDPTPAKVRGATA
jgi:hypothetical protein